MAGSREDEVLAKFAESTKPRSRKRKSKSDVRPASESFSCGGQIFEIREGREGLGVYRLELKTENGERREVETFVCAELRVTHMVRDPQGSNWQRRVAFRDHDGRDRECLIADELLEGDGGTLAKLLRSRGLYVGTNKSGLLKQFINGFRPHARARLTRRIGWHHDVDHPGRWSFVRGGELDPIAHPDAEMWVVDPTGGGHAVFKEAGALEEWQEHVAALAVGNSRLTFGLSAGFAAGLSWVHPNIAGGFHWAGGSSLGKSAILYAVASLCGPPAFRKTWLLTATAIEATAAGHCDAPLLLDELKQAGNPRDVAQAAYMLASGQGKGRGRADGSLRETATFSLLFQSNGEVGLTQFLAENGERSYAGQEVRFCELPANADKGLGAWEALHGRSDGARFSEDLQRNAARFYGTAFPKFVDKIIEHHHELPKRFEELRALFEAQTLSSKAGGQAVRASTRFAAVAFAGELATQWGITGWSVGESTRAARQMFKDWLAAFGGEKDQEPRRIVEQVQAWLQEHSVARLEDWRRPNVSDDHAPRPMHKAGWRRPTESTEHLPKKDQVFEFLVYATVFKRELSAGFDHRRVCFELHRRGLLDVSEAARERESRFTKKVREPGGAGPTSFYVLKPEIMGCLDDPE